MREEPCAIYPVERGVPVTGLGIVILAVTLVPIILGVAPIPVLVLFIGFEVPLI